MGYQNREIFARIWGNQQNASGNAGHVNDWPRTVKPRSGQYLQRAGQRSARDCQDLGLAMPAVCPPEFGG